MNLIVQANKTLTWNQFLSTDYPHKSVALDGFVNEGPKFELDQVKINFNHHEGVSRLETRATCAQVLLAIRQGLMDLSKTFNIYVNDCDEDVCLSVFLLRNWQMVVNPINPLINKLVYMEDMLDTTSGTYSYPSDTKIIKQLNWVFQPYRQMRKLGAISTRDNELFTSVIEDVESRIMYFIVGAAKETDVDDSYKILSHQANFSVVEEGMNSRARMFNDGIRAFIAVKNRSDGKYTYTIGKQSIFIDFPIQKIINKLNEIENGWGGSDIIAGSPRSIGSKLTIEEIVDIIKSIE